MGETFFLLPFTIGITWLLYREGKVWVEYNAFQTLFKRKYFLKYTKHFSKPENVPIKNKNFLQMLKQ